MRVLRVATGQAIAGLRMNRRRSSTAIAGLAAGVAVLTASWHAESLDGGGHVAGVLLLAVVAATTATATDPRQLRAAAVLDLSGASRTQRRAVVVVEAALLGTVACPLGLVAGAVAAGVVGTRAPAASAVVLHAVLVPVAVALVAGRERTRVTAVDARGRPTLPVPLRRPDVRTAIRLIWGPILIWTGYWLASSSRTFFDLDLFLWPGIVLVGCGLGLLLPVAVDAVAWVLARLPWLVPNLDAALLRSRRRLLTPVLILGTVAAFAVAVQAVLGAGLDEREQRRRDYLDGFRFTAALRPDEVVVGRTPQGSPLDTLIWSTPGQDREAGPLRLAADIAERIRTRYPEAEVTPISYLPASTRSQLVSVPFGRWVAAAEPELLAALGLEEHAGDVAAGRAVALDPTVVHDGRARVDVYDFYSGRTPTVTSTLTVDAVVGDLPSVPLELPALLVPPSLDVRTRIEGVADPAFGAHELLIRLPRRATSEDAWALAALASQGAETVSAAPTSFQAVGAWTGTQRLDHPYEQGRLDAADSVTLRRPGEIGVAVTLTAVVALVALFVTLRLATVTRRSDEEVVETLGARPAVLRRLAVVQTTVLATMATTLGLSLGIVLTRMGVADYNRHGRFDGHPLPPIPVVVPGPLLVGLVVVPVVAGALAWLLAWRRPVPSPLGLADGQLW